MKLDDLNAYKAHPIGYSSMHQAAVLIPLIEKEDGLHVLFQVRSSKLDHQPGDICFPGGGKEGNEQPVDTAIREACEELLIDPNQIRIIGPSDWYGDRGRIIYPFAGKLQNYDYTFSSEEVSEVFTVPLSYFMNTSPECYEIDAVMKFPENFPFEKIYGGRDYRWHSRKENIYFWEYEGHVIWGITARMLLGFVTLLKI